MYACVDMSLPGTVTRLPVMGKAVHMHCDDCVYVRGTLLDTGCVLCGEYCLRPVLAACPTKTLFQHIWF